MQHYGCRDAHDSPRTRRRPKAAAAPQARYQTTRQSLASSCYDTAAGDSLLALWHAIVWTMIEQGSFPRSRPLRFTRAPARVVDARGDESQDRDADAERRELLRSQLPAS
jgi:hypothetical protein